MIESTAAAVRTEGQSRLEPAVDRGVAWTLGLALAYYALGRLYLLTANPTDYPTAAWPPAGIALAGLLVFGYRVWPGILIGAFFTAMGPSFHPAGAAAVLRSAGVAAGLAAGVVLQASTGAALIRRFVGFPTALDEAADVAKFLILGGPVACVLGAAWSVTVLALAGIDPWFYYPFNWWTWWVGGSIGVMVVTPLILIWVGEPRAVWRARRLAVGLPLVAAFALAVVVHATPGFRYLGPRGSWQLWAMFATGLAFIGLLTSLLLIVTGRTLKSEALALENSGLYKRYRSLFEGVPVGLYRAAEDGQILDVNPAFLRILDYPSRDALDPVNAANLYLDPELWERWRTQLEGDASVMDFESQMNRSDGSLVWVQASIGATRDASTGVAYYEGAIVDITERKQAQAHVEALNEIVTAAAAAADLQTFLDTLLDRTLAALEGAHGGVWLGAGTFLNRQMPPGFRMETVMSAAEAAGLELTQVQAVDNWEAAAGPLPEALAPAIRRAGVRASIMGPLLVDGRPIGVLLITTARPRRWLAADLRLVEAVGRQIGTVAERLQLLDDVRAHARDMEALHNLGAALRRTTSLGEIYALITERTMALLRGDHAALVLLQPDGRTFQPVRVRAVKGVALDATVAVGPRIAAAAVERAGALVIPDLTTAFGAGGSAAPGGSMGPCVAVPLREGERVIGALVIARRRGGMREPFARRDADLATALAELSSHAIDRTQLTQQVAQELANVRGLYEGAQRMAETLDLQSLADEAVDRCVHVFGATVAWIAKFDEADRVQCLAHYPGETRLGRLIEDWAASTACDAIRAPLAARKSVLVQNVGTGPDATVPAALVADLGVRAAGIFPLISRTSTFGALVLYANHAAFFAPDRVKFFQAYAHQLAAALENARLYDDANRRLAQLQALHEIDQVITGSLDLKASLSVVLAKTAAQLDADAACVLLFNPRLQALEYAAGQGFLTDGSRHVRLKLGEGLAGQAALERQCVGVADLDEAPDALKLISVTHRRRERFRAAYAVPLIAKGQLLGVLHVLYRRPLTPNHEWLEFLDMLARQTAIAISDAQQLRALERSHDDLMLAYDTTLAGWARALELRDKETAGHAQRVTELALRLASQLGVADSDFLHLRHGALLHDIGKMAISDTVLLKPDRLNSTEREMMERHPVYARDLLMSIPYLRPALDIPYCHHEKWDGTGYPRRLQGEQIPLAARIFAVVDVWDALTQDRPYRRAWSEDRAREYIRAELGRHFDPRVGEAFLKMLAQDEVSDADDPRVSMLAPLTASLNGTRDGASAPRADLLLSSATAADPLRGMRSDRVAI